MPFFYIIVKPGYYEEEKLLYAMKQKNRDLLNITYSEFLQEMMCNYSIFYLMTFFLFFFSFYYMVEFSGLYSNSSLGWISGGFQSFAFYLFGIDFFIPLLAAVIKKFVDKNLRFK